MLKFTTVLGATIIAVVSMALAQQKPTVDPMRIDAAVKSAFSTAPDDWQMRLVPDETMKQCSAHDNGPPTVLFDAILAREKSTIMYPADGNFLGDWKKGEALAQSGFGLRFTDYPPGNRTIGGNCYACHQLTKQELSYGTIGPSLLAYGKIRNFGQAETKTTYEKIYNPHASFPCSLMPRFGPNNVLTIEQIRDAVALLMSPDSPVNK